MAESESIACPWCQARFPFKLAMAGKTVRCKQCRKIFTINVDGTTDQVRSASDEDLSVDVTGSGSSTLRPAAAVNPATDTGGSALSPGPGADPGKPANPYKIRTPRPQSERMTKQQESMRMALAAELSASMQQALEAPGVKAEQARTEQQKSEGRVKRTGKSEKGRIISPAVLTGEGETSARRTRLLLIGAVVVVAVVLGLGWLIRKPAPELAALQEFTALVGPADARPGRIITAIRERAWFSDLTATGNVIAPFTNLDDAVFERSGSIPLDKISLILSQVADLTYLPAQNAWVKAEDLPYWQSHTVDPKAIGKASPDQPKAIPLAYFQRQLEEDGMPRTSIDVLMAFLTGKDSDGKNPWRAKLMASGADVTMEWLSFRGATGSLVQDTGTTLRYLDLPYRGVLVRITGPGWPDGWKVLILKTDR